MVIPPVRNTAAYDSRKFGRQHLVTAIDIGSSRMTVAAVLISPSGRYEPFWHSELSYLPCTAVEGASLMVACISPVIHHAQHNFGCTFDGVMLTGRDITALDAFEQELLLNDIKVTAKIPQITAASQAVLSRDDIDAGVCLFHMGDSASSIAVYLDKQRMHQQEISWGGSTITSAIAEQLGIAYHVM